MKFQSLFHSINLIELIYKSPALVLPNYMAYPSPRSYQIPIVFPTPNKNCLDLKINTPINPHDSGADWTILRSSWFAQNFSENFLLEPVLSGLVALPVANVREPFVDVEDIADVAVAALTDSKHIEKLYELSGPRAISFAEATEEIGKACGRDVRYKFISMEQFISELGQVVVLEYLITIMTELFTKVLDGRNSHVTDGVQQALGRVPRDFRDYARSAAKTGVWNAKHD